MSTFKEFTPVNLHPSIQMLMGKLLRNNSPFEVDVSLGHVFLEISKYSFLKIHICAPNLTEIINELTIQGITTLKNVKVSLQKNQSKISVLVKINTQLIFFQGYTNSNITQLGRCQFPQGQNIHHISNMHVSQTSYSWLITTNSGHLYFLQKPIEHERLELREIDGENRIGGILKGIFKPFLPPKRNLIFSFSYITFFEKPQYLYAFTIKNFTFEARFINLMELNNNPVFNKNWSIDLQHLLPSQTKSIIKCQIDYSPEQSQLNLTLITQKTDCIELSCIMFEMLSGNHKTLGTMKFPYTADYPLSLELMQNKIYFISGSQNGCFFRFFDFNSTLVLQSEIKANRGVYRLSRPQKDIIILFGEGQSYIFSTMNCEAIEHYQANESFIQFAMGSTGVGRRKRIHKYIAEKDYFKILTELREQRQELIEEEQQIQRLNISIIIDLFEKIDGIDMIIEQKVKDPIEFSSKLFIQKDTESIRDIFKWLREMELVPVLTAILMKIVHNYSEQSQLLKNHIFEVYCSEIFFLIDNSFRLDLKFPFEQDELLENVMKIYELRSQVENISEDVFDFYLEEERFRNKRDTINFLKRLAIQTSCVSLFIKLFSLHFTGQNDFRGFVENLRNKRSFSEVSKVIQTLIQLDTTQNQSLSILDSVPQEYSYDIYLYVNELNPKIGMAYALKTNQRSSLAADLIKNEQMFEYFSSAFTVNNILVPLLEYDEAKEDGRMVLLANSILCRMIEETNENQIFVPVHLLIEYGKQQEKSEETRIKGDIWAKYRERLELSLGQKNLELLESAILIK